MVKKESVAELVSRLVQGTTYEMLDAAEAIGRTGEKGVRAVAPILKSGDRESRWRAAVALERIGGPAVETLVTAARDEDFLVRVPAIWALERVGDERAVAPLMQNLQGRNECFRWMATAALSRFGDDAVHRTVEEVFVADPFVRGVVDELIEGS